MNNLGQILEYLYPGINLMPGPNADAILEDTGNGPQIVEWHLPGDPPGQAELEAAAEAALSAALLSVIRAERDRLLVASDWTDAAPHLSRAQHKQWQIYRQALRDITEQDPQAIEWPVSPDQTPEYNTWGWLVRLPLDEAREWARQEVNLQAGDRRSYYGTDIPFQAAIYLWKQWEAQGTMPNAANSWPGFLNDPEPSAAKYPILYAEAAGRGIIPLELAQEYAGNAALWPQLMAVIESIRIPVGDALKVAPDHQTIVAILTGLTWPV